MALLEWRDEFSVGDPAVDHEHRELIDMVNRTAGAIAGNGAEADVDRAFGDLLRGISAHFAHEERQMQAARYDHSEAHKDDHEDLIDSLREIMDADRGAPDAAAEHLVEVLETLFTGHFSTHDARLHQVLGPHDHG
jgi:hemerythrin